MAALSHVHSPAARRRQLHRAPVVVFSVAAREQVQARADCFPHEQVAFSAQTQEPERLQQVAGLVTILADFTSVFDRDLFCVLILLLVA